ncbi:MAG: hypothetical protein RLZZ342_379 [Candidatus Parcubacteria bacterium]
MGIANTTRDARWYTYAMGFSLVPHGKKIVALADIGGSGSACALADAGNVPTQIQAVVRTPHVHEDRQGERTIAQLAQTLSTASSQLATMYTQPGISRPSELYAIAHAPWIQSRSIVTERSFETETKITESLIGDMAKEALAGDSSLVREDVCEGSVSHIELNGYPTHAPHGKMAHHVKVVVLVSEMKRAHRDELEHALRPSFPEIPIRWRSYARALASVLGERGSESRNAVIFDISDDGSAVSVLRKNVLTEQKQIAAGTQTLLSLIAGKGSREETLSLLSMLEHGTCTTAQCDEINAALTEAEPAITKIVGQGLGDMAAQRRLPNEAYLFMHEDLAEWFARFIARIDFAQFTISSKPFSVHPLSVADFSHAVAWNAGVAHDLGIALAAALVHTELHKNS